MTMSLNRRQLIGSATAAGAVAAFPIGAKAAIFDEVASITPARFKPVDLFAHHCSLVHTAIGNRLERARLDGSLSAASVTVAHCPCCGTQIDPSAFSADDGGLA